MRLPLILHPDSRCDALTAIEVELVRHAPRRIGLRFVLTGAVRHIVFPGIPDTPRRADELWKSTCFEAFVRAGNETSYLEYNFSPRAHWAAYRFADYRSGREQAPDVVPPEVDPHISYSPPSAYAKAMLDMERMAWLPIDQPWHLGLSAVIEERNGRLSYWALAHPPGAPDFHHRDCFALELPAARPA